MKLSVPLIQSVDILLLGGTVSGCRAALDLKNEGYSVFSVTPFSYFGEDLCAYLDLQSEKSADYISLFGEEAAHPTPVFIKRTLDRKFMDAGIPYLFQSSPVSLLRDSEGAVAGVVIANRSGFQAVAARCILDATEHSLAARLDGAAEKPFVPGVYPVSLIQIGGCARKENLSCVELPLPVLDGDHSFPVFRAVAEMEFREGSPAELRRAEVKMKRLAWHPDVVASADLCRFAFGGVELPDPRTGILLPETFAEAGRILKTRHPGKPCAVRVSGAPNGNGERVRKDRFFRFGDCETIEFDLDALPAGDSCDVLVAGGGTGGAPAAIAAARSGAKTICLETLSCLGGVCTSGMIGNYWFGNRVGFTAELDKGVWGMGPNPSTAIESGQCNGQWKREWLLEQADEAGVDLRFRTMTVAAVVRGNRVCGCVTAGPFGAEVISADAVIDATGNADVAAAAGGETAPLVEEEPAVQGAGLSPVRLGTSCENTDYSFICDSDVVDGTRMFTMAHDKFGAWFDTVQMLDTRERRRIVGDLVLQPQDFFAGNTYSDTVTVAMSNFDTHGFILHPMFMLKATEHQPYYANVPYRALLPRNLEGILVTGLGVSAHRDCMPLIRMQPDVQNQGYAAGLAAAMAAGENLPLRKIDLKALQKQLIARGILPESVLAETDAVGELSPEASHYELAAVFLNEEKERIRLHEQYALSPDLHTAHILAFLGDGCGKSLLESAVRETEWDKGWNYTGMGQFGPSLSPQDSMIFALGRIGGARDIVLEKLRKLNLGDAFSHIRAVSVHLIRHPDPRAEAELVRLLSEEGARGHAVRSLADAVASNRKERNDTSVRNSQLKELYLGKALAACAPENPIGKQILSAYAGSMQGYYALFAQKKENPA